MTNRFMHQLKTIAKRFARAKRIAHHKAIDWIASQLDHPHWRALTVAWEKGWRPSPAQWVGIERLSQVLAPSQSEFNIALFSSSDDQQGYIDGHDYILRLASEVLMTGRGWAIIVEHAPSESPQIETDLRVKDNPVLDPAFREKALGVAQAAVEQLRAHVAADWPRRSTKPDAQGRTLHPLWSELSAKWHCLHCDGVSSGAQMATNMWHCPECSATPIDIYREPFWKGNL